MNPNAQAPDLSPDEQRLIAFHLGEPVSAIEQRRLQARLEDDPAFAALSNDIAHTLRVFSAEAVPRPDTEAAWQRLRGTLPPLEPASAVRGGERLRALVRGWSGLTALAALCLILLAGLLTSRHFAANAHRVNEADVIHLRPPQKAVDLTGETDHLDRAERWLTTVNHASAPLDDATRAEGQHLLTENAVYLRDARNRGDLPDAAVLDHLDRVLTTSNHPAEAGLQLRLDMNTDGLLFQIRILRQNQTAPNGDSQ